MKNILSRFSQETAGKSNATLKSAICTVSAIAIFAGGFFVPVLASAAVTITPASGGANISIDTTSASGGSGMYQTLSGPTINETSPGDISFGTHTFTLPSGWEFNSGSTVTVVRTAGDIQPDSQVITPSLNSFTFTITNASTANSGLAFILNSMRVRPTGTVPSTGTITHSGASIAGVTNGSTSFGTLSTIPGTVTKLAFTTEPSGAVYGSLLGTQPVVKTQDQFGNNSTNGLSANKLIALSLSSGTGSLLGTASLDIGTSAGNGTATFGGLTVNEFGAEKQLTASADSLTPAVSTAFEITKKTLTATITADSKVYDGNNSATFTSPVPVGTEFSDALTLSGGTATFVDANVGTSKTVTATGLVLAGTKFENYNYYGTGIGAANITALPITITPTVGQTKIYGQVEPTFAYTFSPALISLDVFSGALSRDAGENVNTYAYTLGTLSAGSNYSLTLVPGTFGITQRTLNVTATGINKVYDGNPTATVNLLDDRVGSDDLTLGYAAAFADKNIGIGKPVSVTVISITGGTAAGNYTLGNTTTSTSADIIAKPLTISFTTYANKTYDGTTSADIMRSDGTLVLSGVVGTEDVHITDGSGSATFANKNVGPGKVVTATGFTLAGDDRGNYIIGTINTTTGNITARPITVTAGTDNKIYDGTVNSLIIPSITVGSLQNSDTANFIQTFDTRKASSSGKTLTPSGIVNDGNSGLNYEYHFVTNTTGAITPKPINVTAQTDTKTYDGNTDSSVIPSADALATGDSTTTPPTQTFDTKDVGTGKTLTATGLVINDGNGGANYSIHYVTDITGVINKKELTVTGVITNPKVYDGTLDATLDGSAALVGVISPDVVTVSTSTAVAVFNNRNVNTGKTVIVTGITTGGTNAGNYSLTQPILHDGVITQKTLNVTATGINKVYDGNPTATINLLNNRVSGDVLTLGYTATFADKNVGNVKAVTISGVSITGGADNGNYTLGSTPSGTTADITPATLTATIAVANKVFDGNTGATITGYTPVGVIGSDVVTLSGGTANFADSAVGTGKTVSATGIAISGIDAGNYSYNNTATGVADILPIPTTVFVDASFTGSSAGGHTFGYDAFNTIQGGVNAVDVGGTVNVAAGTYSENVIVNKALALSGSSGVIQGAVQLGISNVTINGFTINGGTLSGLGGDNPVGIYILAGTSGHTIQNNIITGSGTSAGRGILFGYNVTGTIVENNEISNWLSGVYINPSNNLSFTGNNIHNNYAGIGSDGISNVTISGNTFANNTEGFGSSNVGTNVAVHSNKFVGNDAGVNWYPGTSNKINTTGNWWGYITGPTYSSNTGGSGDSVSDNVTFTPWCTNVECSQIDSTAPVAVLSGTPANPTNQISAGITVSGDLQVIYYEYKLDGGSYGPATLVATPITLSSLADGSHTISVIGRDQAGNWQSEGSATTHTWTVDTVAPTISSLTKDHADLIVRDADTVVITAAFNKAMASSPTISIGSVVSGKAMTNTSGNIWAYTWDVPAGNDGSATATVAGTDLAGNPYVGADNLAFTIDNTAPVVSVTDPIAAARVNGDKVIKFSDGESTAPQCSIDNLSWVACSTGVTTLGGLTGFNDLADGSFTLYLQDTDNAGNVGTATPISLTKDSVAPTITSRYPNNGSTGIKLDANIIATTSEPISFNASNVTLVKTSDSSPIAFAVSGNGTNAVTVNPSVDLASNTKYTITIHDVTDLAGNALPSASWSFITATRYSIPLSNGWNLISLPVNPASTNVANVLGALNDSATIDSVWAYDAATGNWMTYHPGAAPELSNLSTMTAGRGYWINYLPSTDAAISGEGGLLGAGGPTIPPQQTLYPGWNLIGYYQLDNEASSTPPKALFTLINSDSGQQLWSQLSTFDNSVKQYKTAVTNSDTMNPGEGYWIYMKNSSFSPYSYGPGLSQS